VRLKIPGGFSSDFAKKKPTGLNLDYRGTPPPGGGGGGSGVPSKQIGVGLLRHPYIKKAHKPTEKSFDLGIAVTVGRNSTVFDNSAIRPSKKGFFLAEGGNTQKRGPKSVPPLKS